ncbi:MAG: 3-hydroxyacyl-CoA dehydrogenase family protein [Chitinophagaceae bacterium]
MKIAVRANDEQKQEFLSKKIPENIEIIWLDEKNFLNEVESEIYFDLLFDEINVSKNKFTGNKPVFANAVIPICSELPSNYIRINAWNGFLKRDLMEVCASSDFTKKLAKKTLDYLQWNFQFVCDEPGMISARIICMIINEAYFALGDEISTKKEIDIAMKLGTNYPYGPFEWSEKIGLKRIYFLLKKLSEKDEKRYAIAPKFLEETRIVS